jgi:hypothetical protein
LRRPARSVTTLLIVVAALLIGLPVLTSAAVSTLEANADSFVLSTNVRANKGTAASLKIRNGTKVAYVRFDVPALPPGEQVGGVTLRLYATPSNCPLEVLRAANDAWGERTITWGNQPGSLGSIVTGAAWTTKGYRDLDVTSAIQGAGPVSFVLRHAAGCAASSDVGINSREASANRPQLVVETATAPPPPACSDGTDNDMDGRTDHPSDPGCTDPSDTDEADPPPPPPTAACADGLDNDADGLTDHPADPGCSTLGDIDETDPVPGVVIATAGDIVCDPEGADFGGAEPSVCQHRATADLLAGADAVLALGDLQYPGGELGHFMAGYDPTWGQHAPVTFPAVGNHEYHVPSAQGYFDYWAMKGRPTGGLGAGYYHTDLGAWRLIALNSNCTPVPCGEGSTQNDFLEQALAQPAPSCILAYWHHPLFNSGAGHGASMPSGAKAFWVDLYAAGADIVLNGHEHNYQRYGKQDPAGNASQNGIREFVVGTGGKSHYALLDAKDANFEFGNSTDFGVLKLRLHDDSYAWEFVATNGTVLDAGGPVPCN